MMMATQKEQRSPTPSDNSSANGLTAKSTTIDNPCVTQLASANSKKPRNHARDTSSTSSKTKRTKSRNGCLTCKKRRLKCDETKPDCVNCTKKSIPCGGYATSFKWRPFNDEPVNLASSLKDSAFSVKPASRIIDPEEKSGSDEDTLPAKGRTASQEEILQKHLDLASRSVTGKSSKDIERENELISRGINPLKRHQHLTIQENGQKMSHSVPSVKKKKRSHSHSSVLVHDLKTEPDLDDQVSIAQSPSSHQNTLTRTLSTSNAPSPHALAELRNNYSRFRSGHTLDSLADAALDEISAHSPAGLVADGLSPNFSRFGNSQVSLPTVTPTPSEGGQDFKGHSDGDVQVFASKKGSEIDSHDMVKYQKHHDLHQAGDPHKLDHMPNSIPTLHDLNLTPNLTALINYAFTECNDDGGGSGTNHPSSTKLNDIMDLPLSPLALTSTHPHKDHSAYYESDENHHISAQNHHFDVNLPERHSPRLDFSSSSQHAGIGHSPIKISLLQGEHSPVSPKLGASPSQSSLMKTSEHEQILFLFSQHTSSIMSIKNGPRENPWRHRIAPLASNYPCLFNSIACMTLFHLAGNHEIAGNGTQLRMKGCDYMKRCIMELATGLSRANDDSVTSADETTGNHSALPADVALATCLNLAVSESWDTHTSSGIAHLKGAKSMIQKVLGMFREHAHMIIAKKREMDQTGSPPNGDYSLEEYMSHIKKDRNKIKHKMVLVEDSEWDKMEQNVLVSCYRQGQSSFNFIQKGGSHEIYVPSILQFLFNVWIYFEVLAQMTTSSNHDDKGIDLVATITTILEETQKKRISEENQKAFHKLSGSGKSSDFQKSPSTNSESNDSPFSFDPTGSSSSSRSGGFNFFENFDSINLRNEYIDPLLGCAQSLFSIMGKVANLISKINKARQKAETKSNESGKKVKSGGKLSAYRNSLFTISQATQLRQRLLDWRPTISSNMLGPSNGHQGDAGWDMPSCIATAESYRYATLLYLHQAAPEIPSLSSHQLAEKVFILLASIPSSSNLAVVHIFPLLVASCEAEPGEEREWCESRWTVLRDRMWIGNIDRALEVVKEVWRRKDQYRDFAHDEKGIRDGDDGQFEYNLIRTSDKGVDKSDIAMQISGLMAAISDEPHTSSVDDLMGSISSQLHWSAVMREWKWEVLLG